MHVCVFGGALGKMCCGRKQTQISIYKHYKYETKFKKIIYKMITDYYLSWTQTYTKMLWSWCPNTSFSQLHFLVILENLKSQDRFTEQWNIDYRSRQCLQKKGYCIVIKMGSVSKESQDRQRYCSATCWQYMTDT